MIHLIRRYNFTVITVRVNIRKKQFYLTLIIRPIHAHQLKGGVIAKGEEWEENDRFWQVILWRGGIRVFPKRFSHGGGGVF